MRRVRSAVALAAVMIIATACVDTSLEPGSPTTTAGGNGRLLSFTNKVGPQGFGFNSTVSGAPTGVVFLTGGGSYDAVTASNTVPTVTRVAGGGGFRCVDGVAQGRLSGCATGEGVRWDAAQLLVSARFRCTGADTAKVAFTDARTAALLSDFYRAGDGIEESFVAQMIVSATDIADDVPGVQNVWVQGVGCGSAVGNFGR